MTDELTSDEFVDMLAEAISAALPPGAEWWVVSRTLHPDPSGALIIEEAASGYEAQLPAFIVGDR